MAKHWAHRLKQQIANDAIAKERLAIAWSRLYDENENLRLALRASDNVHHRELDHCPLCEEEAERLAREEA